MIVLTKFFLVNSYSIISNSMSPTLQEGDYVAGIKAFYSIKNNNLIIFKKNESTYLKRVIASQGDIVLVSNGLIKVNNIILYKTKDKSINQSTELNKDEFFVVGDNIDQSIDSRQFGVVLGSEIIAKPVAIWASFQFGRKDILNPERIARPL